MISNEIERLQNAKASIKQKIIEKGVEVADEKLDEYPNLIDLISTTSNENTFTAPEYHTTMPEIGGGVEGGLHRCITEISGIKGTQINDYRYLFQGWESLLKFSETIDTSKVEDLEGFFRGCTKLKDITNFKTDGAKNLSSTFSLCENLAELPMLNTSNVTNLSSTFYYCSNLKNIPLIDTSNVTQMINTFAFCKNITTIPKIDTSSVIKGNMMFYNCTNLISIPTFNFTKLEGLSQAFAMCINLKEIPTIDTSKVTTVYGIFYGCEKLEHINILDFSSVQECYNMFYNCSSLNQIDGFKNLGKGFNNASYKSAHNYSQKIELKYSPNLSKESLLNIFNNLYDLNLTYDVANGGTLYTQDIVLGTENYAKLTASEIKIATDKGWTVLEK